MLLLVKGGNLRFVWRLLVKWAFSLLCAGLFYFAWLALFLIGTGRESWTLGGLLWAVAPGATALGFTVGIAAVEHLEGRHELSFFHVFIWPLIGCAVGAGALNIAVGQKALTVGAIGLGHFILEYMAFFEQCEEYILYYLGMIGRAGGGKKVERDSQLLP